MLCHCWLRRGMFGSLWTRISRQLSLQCEAGICTRLVLGEKPFGLTRSSRSLLPRKHRAGSSGVRWVLRECSPRVSCWWKVAERLHCCCRPQFLGWIKGRGHKVAREPGAEDSWGEKMLSFSQWKRKGKAEMWIYSQEIEMWGSGFSIKNQIFIKHKWFLCNGGNKPIV